MNSVSRICKYKPPDNKQSKKRNEKVSAATPQINIDNKSNNNTNQSNKPSFNNTTNKTKTDNKINPNPNNKNTQQQITAQNQKTFNKSNNISSSFLKEVKKPSTSVENSNNLNKNSVPNKNTYQK